MTLMRCVVSLEDMLEIRGEQICICIFWFIIKAMESIRQWEGLLSNAKIICKFVSLDNAFKKEGKV